jgi:hypothetical protein
MLIASRPWSVMRRAIGPSRSSRRQTGSEPAARTSSSKPARMSLSAALRVASPLTFAGSSTPRSSRCEATDRLMSCVLLSLDIGIRRWCGVGAATTTAPPRPRSRRGRIPRHGAWNGHTTAPFADECQSFLDNVIAGLGQIEAWNDPRDVPAPSRAAVRAIENCCSVLGPLALLYRPNISGGPITRSSRRLGCRVRPEFQHQALQLEPRRALDQKVGGLGAFVDAIHIIHRPNSTQTCCGIHKLMPKRAARRA